jgi:sulfate/thiosulfate transport system substrate-binding protein
MVVIEYRKEKNRRENVTSKKISIGAIILIVALAIVSTGCPPKTPTEKPGGPGGNVPGQSTQGQPSVAGGDLTMINVSYDPTRELYEEYNPVFAAYWKTKTGQNVTITQSHGGSGKQANAVINGNEADVVTLALAYDITAIQNAGLIKPGWQQAFPQNSCPYTSTIVFLVRKGNPKAIKDWPDLAKAGVEVITPNPKSSGGARWNFLAAWGFALKQPGGTEETAKDLVTKIFKNTKALGSGARDSLTTFTKAEQGDVLIAWENEAMLAINELGADKYEIVVPTISILAEPPVAIVDTYADKHKTREVAKEYLNYLYSDAGQDIIAKHYYRPRNEAVMAKYADKFPKVEMFTIDEMFGGWDASQAKFFNDGGVFDLIYKPGTK